MLIEIPTPEGVNICRHRDIGAVEVEYLLPVSLLRYAKEEAEAEGWRFVKARVLDDFRCIVTIRKVTPWPE
jgi:hypothetical protein